MIFDFKDACITNKYEFQDNIKEIIKLSLWLLLEKGIISHMGTQFEKGKWEFLITYNDYEIFISNIESEEATCQFKKNGCYFGESDFKIYNKDILNDLHSAQYYCKDIIKYGHMLQNNIDSFKFKDEFKKYYKEYL